MIIGIALAWITSRTDTLAARFFDNAFVVPYYLSPFIGAISWTLLANPRIGFINNLFTEILGFDDAPFNIYTLGGLVFVMAVYYSPDRFPVRRQRFALHGPRPRGGLAHWLSRRRSAPSCA